MSDQDDDRALQGEGQGGGTGGLVGNEASPGPADPTDRPDLDPDAWDAKPADEEFYPERDDPAFASREQPGRGFAGDAADDPGETEGQPPPGPR